MANRRRRTAGPRRGGCLTLILMPFALILGLILALPSLFTAGLFLAIGLFFLWTAVQILIGG